MSSTLTRVQEAKQGVVSLPDDDSHAVEGVLAFTYTLEYPDWVHNELPNPGCRNELSTGHKSKIPATQWETHLGLFVVADKYQIKVLKKMAKIKLQTAMMDEWMVGNFSELLGELWQMQQSGVEDLKEQALSIVCANSEQLEQKPGFQELIETNSAFSKDFVHRMIVARKLLQEELKTVAENNKKVLAKLQAKMDNWYYDGNGGSSNNSRIQEVIDEWNAAP